MDDHTVISPDAFGDSYHQTSDECAFDGCPDDGTETLNAGVRFGFDGPIVDCALKLCAKHHGEMTGVSLGSAYITFTN